MSPRSGDLLRGPRCGEVRLEPALHPRVLAANATMHDGIAAPCTKPYLHHAYEAEALVPSPARRPLHAHELLQLVGRWRGDGTVCLVRLPEPLRSTSRVAFRPLDDCHDERDFQSRLGDASLDSLAASLGKAIAGWAQLATDFRFRISRAGLPTVTDRDGRLIGLHLDSWYRDGPMRDDPPARLCLNLGTQPRAFLCVCAPPTPLLRPAGGDGEVPLEGTGLARHRLAQHQGPVLRLRVPPGWGYIAPTEKLVHDGSTEDMSAWDVVAHVHGWFDLTAMPAAWRA